MCLAGEPRRAAFLGAPDLLGDGLDGGGDGHVEMEKQFDGLKLEVHRINRFVEHENLVNPQSKPGILLSQRLFPRVLARLLVVLVSTVSILLTRITSRR